MAHKLLWTLLKIYTVFFVLFLRCCGKKIRVGRNSVIYPSARVCPNAGMIKIGRDCKIFPGAVIRAWQGKVVLGNNVSVNDYAVLHGISRLYIGDDCRIASHVAIIPANHGIDDQDRPVRMQPLTKRGIRIGRDVWIGAGAQILDGVHLAQGTIIGAGSVVTKSTLPYGIYAGNPARLLRKRGEKAANAQGSDYEDSTG